MSKCYGEMVLVNDDVTAVNRCDNCHGLHFELLNQQNLDEVAAHTHLDTGNDSMGEEYNEMVYVECPKCDQIMESAIHRRTGGKSVLNSVSPATRLFLTLANSDSI